MKTKKQRSSTARADFFLDTYHPKQDGTCNLKVRVYFNRRNMYYSTDVDLTRGDFEKVMFNKRRSPEQNEIYIKLTNYLARANETITQLGSKFNFDSFESLFLESKVSFDSVAYAFNVKIEELLLNGQIETASTYKNAQNSLLEFERSRSKRKLDNFKSQLTFIEITPVFLKRYEKWMLESGKSITTVGIYLRNLRTLFNSKDFEPALYPFGRGKYEIPTARNIKKALTIEQIAAIYNYQPETEAEERARDYWMFLYLSNGMNVKDFCLLQWKNIKNDFLTYERAKTKNTTQEKTEIQVSLKDEALAIIDKWGQKTISKEVYIFPHLELGMPPERQSKIIKQLTKTINKYMDRIGQNLGIDHKITTYYARHSFATILKRSGADIAMISDLLGHSDIKTTQNYLGSFEDDQIKKQTDVLTAFRNVKIS